MSQFTYVVVVHASGEVGPITRSDGNLVPWADSDFQAWNSAQPTPYTLSAAQQAIQSAKAMTFAQFQTWLTAQYSGVAQPAGVARLLYELTQRALKNEIV